MIDETETAVIELFTTLLEDDDGVCQDAYICMYDVADALKSAKLGKLLDNVSGTDGRFYLD